MILNKTGVNILLQKTFNSILQMNIQGTIIYKGLKYFKFMQKRNELCYEKRSF